MSDRPLILLPRRFRAPIEQAGPNRNINVPDDILIGADVGKIRIHDDGTVNCTLTTPKQLSRDYFELNNLYTLESPSVYAVTPTEDKRIAYEAFKASWDTARAAFIKDKSEWDNYRALGEIIHQPKYCNNFNTHVAIYNKLREASAVFVPGGTSQLPTTEAEQDAEENQQKAIDGTAKTVKNVVIWGAAGVGLYLLASLAIQSSKK